MGDANRFITLINIPSPYRVHFFHMLDAELRKSGWSFEAYFMANSEKGRYWEMESGGWSFRHRFGRGVHPHFSGTTFHFNPDLIRSLVQNPPERLLLCGGWFLPTIASAAASVIVRKSKVYFWSELNMRSNSAQ